jgi:hypothetical protein
MLCGETAGAHSYDRVSGRYFCPISMEMMEDPVVAADGHSYERAEIEKW